MRSKAIFFAYISTLLQFVMAQIDDDDVGYSMPAGRTKNPQLTSIEAACDASGLQITVQFDLPFNGIIYSKGSYYTQGCTFVLANNQLNRYSFNIPIDACGTQSGNDDTKSPPVRYIENTIIMQNDAMYQQQSDIARQVRCNWNTDFRSTITFTPFQVDMRKAISVSFNGNDVTTAMSVQVGRGPFAPVIREALVQIGDTLTLVIYLQTKDLELEIQVLDCMASDGRNRNVIKLTDENGCVLKEKLISPWMTTRETQNTAAQIAYAYLTAFKFPDDMTVNLQCNIAVCKGGCPSKGCAGNRYGELPQPARAINEPNAYVQRRTTQPPEEEGYGMVRTLPPPPPTARRTTSTTTPEQEGYGFVRTLPHTYPTTARRIVITTPEEEEEVYAPPPTTRRTTTTTTTTTTTAPPYYPPMTPRRVIPSYAEEETDAPVYRYTFEPVTRPPTLRRRTVFDRRRRALDDATNLFQGQTPLSSSIRVISPSDVSSPNSTILRQSLQTGDLSRVLCLSTALFAVIVAVLVVLLLVSCVVSTLLCIRQRGISKKEREINEYDYGTSVQEIPYGSSAKHY